MEWIRDKPVAHPNPRLSLVIEPAFRAEELVHGPIKILVMRKLNVATDVPSKALLIKKGRRQPAGTGVGLQQQPVALLQLLQPPGGAQSGWPGADNEYPGFIHSWRRDRRGAAALRLPHCFGASIKERFGLILINRQFSAEAPGPGPLAR